MHHDSSHSVSSKNQGFHGDQAFVKCGFLSLATFKWL